MVSLFPVALRGIGTLEIEAIGSYVHRLASAHGVTAGRLLDTVLREVDYEETANTPAVKYYMRLATLVRPNATSRIVVNALQKCTGRSDLFGTTFNALQHALHRSVGVFAGTFRWCPACMGEFERAGDSGYYKLAWHLNDITHCHIHAVTLVDRCHYCGSKQDGLGYKSMCTACQKCGKTLSASDEDPPDRAAASHGADLYSLVDAIAHDPNLCFPEGAVRKVVSHLFDKVWAEGSEKQLWGVIPRDECIGIDSGHIPITLTIARRLAARLGMDLIDLLSGELTNAIGVLDPVWYVNLPSEMRPKKRRRLQDKDKVFDGLVNELSVDSRAPMPLSKIAGSLGVSVGFVHYRYPILASQIIARYSAWQNSQRLENQRNARAKALEYFSDRMDGVASMSKKDALRTIRQKTGLPKNLLREEINAVHDSLFDKITNA